MVKTSPSNAGGAGSAPGQTPKIPHSSLPKTKTIHKTVDAVREIGVCHRGLYENMDFVSAAFSMGIDPYALADVLRQEPDAIEDDYKYYDCLINYGGKPVDLEFRIIRGRYKRG